MDSYDRALKRRDFVIIIGLLIAVSCAIAAVARGEDYTITGSFEADVIGPNEVYEAEVVIGESYLTIGEGTTAPNSDYEIYFTPQFNGKCPVCQFQGLKSIVYQGGCTATLLGWQPYYDEEGRYHSEDPNTTTCGYRCSNGHHFSTSCQRGQCATGANIYEGMDKHDWPWIEPKELSLNLTTWADTSTISTGSYLYADADGTLSWTSYSFPSGPSWWNKLWGWLLLGINYKYNQNKGE